MDIDKRIGVERPTSKAWRFALRGQYLETLAGEDPLDLALAVREYAAALRFADPEKDLFYDLVKILCELIPLAACLPDDLDSILYVLATRFKDSKPGRPVLELKANWRRWLRALVLMRFGAGRRAKNLLELARRDFIAASALPEYLAVTLDLGELYHYQRGDQAKLRLLTSDALYCYRSRENAAARAALLLWRDGVLHDDLFEEWIVYARRETGLWMRKDLEKRARNPKYRGPIFEESASLKG